MRKMIRWVGFVGACFAMAACMTMQSMPTDEASLRRDLKPGDYVTVTRSGHSDLSFKVEGVDKEGIHGSGIHVPFKEVQGISREETSWWRTGLIAAAGAAAIVLLTTHKNSGGGGGGGGW